MAATAEPRNPFYLMLLVASLLFVVTVLAYAVIPVLEEKARDAGQAVPPSELRDALRTDGWKWVLLELAAIVILGLACMGLDRYRRWQIERDAAPAQPPPPAPESEPDGRK